MAKKKPKRKVTRGSLSSIDIEACDDGYMLTFNGEPLLTPALDKVVHERLDVLSHIISEFDSFGSIGVCDQVLVEPSVFSAFTIYGMQKENIESEKDPFLENFEACLRGDSIFFPAPGPNEEMAQRSRWMPVYLWAAERDLKVPSLVQYWGDLADPEEDEEFRNNRESYTPPQEFVEAVKDAYTSLSAEQKASLLALNLMHHAVMFPLVFVTGKCSVNEYVSGIMAQHGIVAEDYSALAIESEDHRNEFVNYRDSARVVTEWLSLFPTPSSSNEMLQKEIESGESTHREFKSSLRWHIHKSKFDEIITYSVIKTLAAFLNSSGGVLLIGVEDDGKICGIQHDGFSNEDKFLLHLFNCITAWLGKQHAARVHADIISIEQKKVCRIECKEYAGDWAYLRRKNDEEFFIRIGPSSQPLKPSEIEKYQKEKQIP